MSVQQTKPKLKTRKRIKVQCIASLLFIAFISFVLFFKSVFIVICSYTLVNKIYFSLVKSWFKPTGLSGRSLKNPRRGTRSIHDGGGGSDGATDCEPKKNASLKVYTQNIPGIKFSAKNIQDLNISILIYSIKQTLRPLDPNKIARL